MSAHPMHCLGDVRVAFSGGGLRSLSVSSIFTSVLKELGVWDKVTWVAGVSGGGWHVGCGCNTNYTSLPQVEEELAGTLEAGITTTANAVKSVFTFFAQGPQKALQQFDQTKGLTFTKLLDAVKILTQQDTINCDRRRLVCFEASNGSRWVDADVELAKDGKIETLRIGDETYSSDVLKNANVVLSTTIRVVHGPDGRPQQRQSKKWKVSLETVLAMASSAHQAAMIDEMEIELPSTTPSSSSVSVGQQLHPSTSIEVRDAGIHNHISNMPLRNLIRKPSADRSKPLTLIVLDNGSSKDPLAEFEAGLQTLAAQNSMRYCTTSVSSSHRVLVSESCVVHRFSLPLLNVIYFTGDNNPGLGSALSPSRIDPRILANQFGENLLSALNYLSRQ